MTIDQEDVCRAEVLHKDISGNAVELIEICGMQEHLGGIVGAQGIGGPPSQACRRRGFTSAEAPITLAVYREMMVCISLA